jgi:activator of HSP90 ATPase
MKKIAFTIQTELPVSPTILYNAWLSGKQHAKMTGGTATGQKKIQGTFTAWNGYITGKNIELVENKKIKQTWRTLEFDENQEDSIIEVQFIEKSKGITLLTITHSNLLEKDIIYQQGWIDNYFKPMQIYFSSSNENTFLKTL